jgi:hypothetical protein
VPGIAAFVVLLWINWSQLASIKIPVLTQKKFGSIFSNRLPDILLVLVLLGMFSVRLGGVSNIDLPMWGDSYQHTMITQLMLDNGGLFNSWEPYAPLESLTYHFGFHADAALFGWLSQLPAARVVLWVGQILNGLAVLAVLPFTVRLGGNRWAGIVAVLLAGLCFSLPMEYVNWGRYTQLAGQTILPVFVLFLLICFSEDKPDWKKIVILAILLSGLALTHYRILIFALAAIPAFMILELRRKNYKSILTQVVVLGVLSGILFLPWFVQVYGGRVLAILQSQLTTPPASNPAGLEQYNAIGEITAYLPIWAWLTLPVVILAGLWLRKKHVAFIVIWWFVLLLAANPAVVKLPGTGTLSNFAVFIAAYIPAAILIGSGIGWITDIHPFQQVRTQKAISALFVFITMTVMYWGGKDRLSDIRPEEFALGVRPDLHAAAWIRENTPLEAKFVVNFFFSYLDQLIVGSDGGWWLPLLSLRQTNLPPLTYGIEDSSGDAYMILINDLAHDIQEMGITDPQIIDRLLAVGIEYVYIGQRQGEVNNPGEVVLDPEEIRQDPHFQELYQQDRVWIFKIVP